MIIEAISQAHNRLAFFSGDERLDRYMHEQAAQAKKKGLAATFVAIDPEGDASAILGYYSLSSSFIAGDSIPDEVRKMQHLPTHAIGATLLGRLAVARSHQRGGLGRRLIVDAFKRAYRVSGDVGSVAVIVDAVSPEAARWYARFGFVPTVTSDVKLLILMNTIARTLPGLSPFIYPELAALRSA